MRFLRVLDRHVLLVVVLAVVATWASIRVGVRADLPTELVAVAIVFPIVFSINAAYRRREEALVSLASLKASIAGIFYAHRDWVPEGAPHAERASELVARFYDAVQRAISCAARDRPARRGEVARAMSDISRSIEDLRRAGLSPTEASRVNNYLNRAHFDFERLRTIAEYRTPGSLRAFSKVYLNLFPILFAPFYAQIAFEAGTWVGYGVAVAFAVVLCGLDNVQDHLENPFDGIGVDDVRLGAYGELYWLPEGPAHDQERP